MKSSKNTSLISKEKITLFGKLYKKEKPQNNTQICNTSVNMDKKRKGKRLTICITSFLSFPPHNNDPVKEVEQDIDMTVIWQ